MLAEAIRLGAHRIEMGVRTARFSPTTALVALALGVVLGWLVILLVLIGRTAGG